MMNKLKRLLRLIINYEMRTGAKAPAKWYEMGSEFFKKLAEESKDERKF